MQKDAVITYKASKMTVVHSGAGFLNEHNACNQVSGHIYLSDDVKFPPNNGATLTHTQVIKVVMLLAT